MSDQSTDRPDDRSAGRVCSSPNDTVGYCRPISDILWRHLLCLLTILIRRRGVCFWTRRGLLMNRDDRRVRWWRVQWRINVCRWNGGSNDARADRCGWGPGLRRVSRLIIAFSLLATVRLEKPTSWLKRQGRVRLRATWLHMSELSAAETFDPGVIAASLWLRAEPPVLINRWSTSWLLSRGIRLSGNRTHFISHQTSHGEYLLQRGYTGRIWRSPVCPWGMVTHGKHCFQFTVVLRVGRFNLLVYRKCLFRRPV